MSEAGERPPATLFQLACLAYQGGLHQMMEFLAFVYPAVSAGAFLAVYFLALEGIA